MKTTASGMGKGLAALLGDEAFSIPLQEKVLMIPIHQIAPSPYQPRQNFPEESLRELEQSIREQGVLLPILVRAKRSFEEMYQLIAGERRWRAAKMAGLNEIPALMRHWNDRQALEASILENVQREDLNPVEIARGCAVLSEKFGYSHRKTAQRIGKSREAVTNLVRLLRLPEAILAMIESGILSTSHARAMLRLEGKPELMERLASEVLSKELSVRQTEALARVMEEESETKDADEALSATDEEGQEGVEAKATPSNRGRKKDPMILSIERRLTDTLSAPVSITHLRGKGKLIVSYSSLDELEVLADKLLLKKPS
ncbi:MAG: ParB/RepB/Spo0J family partition protein [Magnetococcales bacterium]|nr:ParB/RepB/Spo0J family partition protein [Magnetococcales bacterium]